MPFVDGMLGRARGRRSVTRLDRGGQSIKVGHGGRSPCASTVAPVAAERRGGRLVSSE
jgi:hypothetical protein